MVESLHVLYATQGCGLQALIVDSIQGSAVSPTITKRDPRVYVEVSRSFSFLWAPGIAKRRTVGIARYLIAIAPACMCRKVDIL